MTGRQLVKTQERKKERESNQLYCSLLVFCLVPLPLFILQPRNPAVMSYYSNPGVSSLPRSLTNHSTIIRDKGMSRHNQTGLKCTGGKSDKTASDFVDFTPKSGPTFTYFPQNPTTRQQEAVEFVWSSDWCSKTGRRTGEECGCSHAHFFQVGAAATSVASCHHP